VFNATSGRVYSQRYVSANVAALLTLTNQETYTNTTHVEPIQPFLYTLVYPPRLLLPLPLEDALGNGSDSWIVPLFYIL
jgi:hypothetical protein